MSGKAIVQGSLSLSLCQTCVGGVRRTVLPSYEVPTLLKSRTAHHTSTSGTQSTEVKNKNPEIQEFHFILTFFCRSVCKKVEEQCQSIFPKDQHGAVIFPRGLPSCSNTLTAHYSFDFAQQVI